MMQPDTETLSRRSFAKLAAAAFATTAGAMRAAGEGYAPKAPGAIVRVRSKELELELDVEVASGLPRTYRLPGTGVEFAGDREGRPPLVRVCRLAPRGYASVEATVERTAVHGQTMTVECSANFAPGVRAARFEIEYVLKGSSIIVRSANIREEAGYELIEVRLPSLVSTSERDKEAWVAYADRGGDVVTLSDAKQGTLPANSFWGDVHGVLPVLMAGHSGAVCVLETTAYMDGTLLAIRSAIAERVGTLGTSHVHRVDGSGCYDMNLGRGVPKSCGNESTPNLLVEDASQCRLDFLAVRGKRLTWVDGAKLVRARMPSMPNPYYRDRYVYGIRVDEPLFPKPSATFARCEELIRQVHWLTDGAPQLVHLWGWQFRGKDTGYPAVNVVNERVGGYEAMMRLMERAKTLNADVSLSDNYDDAYKSSPEWDEEMIARKPDGDLWKSRQWTGEESYIQGLAKYMEGPGRERVRYTCERYKLPGTIHVDVLSYYAIRNDWDRKRPASGIRNLRAGRYRVLEEFKAHGVDVTSEGLRYPYIGRMSFCWYAGTHPPCPLGGKAVPMLSLIYKQSAIWGHAARGAVEDAAGQMLFAGEPPHSIVMGDTPLENMMDAYYLVTAPWRLLQSMDIESVERDNERVHVEFGHADSRLELDEKSGAYRLTINGREVARNGQTVCPLDDNRIALYRTTPDEVSVTLPDGWSKGGVRARALFADHHATQDVHVDGHIAKVRLEARRPVILERA